MNRNVYLAGAAVAVACVTAGLVIIIGRPSPSTPAIAASVVTSTAAANTTSGTPPASSAPPPIIAGVTPPSTPTPDTPASATTGQPGHLRVFVTKLPAAKQTDAMVVAQTFIATMYSVDPTVDSDRTDAAHRTAYLMTPTLAATLTTPPTTGTGVQWQQWVDTKAYVTVTSKKINIAWTVADNRLSVVRNVGFIQTVHTTQGIQALQQQTLALTLVRPADGQPWRVNSMETP